MKKKLIIYSKPNNPYFNIALDEALFLSAIDSRDSIIRLWTNKNPCIYLGLSKKHKQEFFQDHCSNDNIPIIRRFSGGGTVLHSKGNLNFSFIFPLEQYKNLQNLKQSYLEIFKIIKKILEPYISNINFQGSSDFCIGNTKFSGNAQARKKNTLLHHGTIMVDNDLSFINKYLKQPLDIPAYRKTRSHKNFLTTLKQHNNNNITTDKIIESFKKNFSSHCVCKPTKQELEQAEKLMQEKYTQNWWNYCLVESRESKRLSTKSRY